MPRYIDAEKLRYVMERYDDYAVDIVDDAPTVDAVEVVRCKDCAFWDKDGEKKEIHMSLCCINQMYTFDYFYCDYGRRENEAFCG